MSLYSLLSTAGIDLNTIGWLVVILLVVVQVTPIKIDPLGYIGKKLNKDTNDKIDKVVSNVDKLRDDVSQLEMRTARQWIIVFDDERQNGKDHTEDYCNQILEACDVYKAYCINHPEFQNHKGQNALKRIEEASEAGTLQDGVKKK